MPVNVSSEPLYWGFKLYELLTLLGIISGPIIAVVITLLIESRRRKRDSQIQIMRMLLNSRHMPSDSSYNVAINLVPIEFNKKENVMNAWRVYIEHVSIKPTQENQDTHWRMTTAKQTKLIFQIMKSLGFVLSETDIQTSAYVSEGFMKRDNLYLASLQATCDIATAIKEQNAFVRNSIINRTSNS